MNDVIPVVLDDSFWSKVDTTGGPEACWPWVASRTGDGYGTKQFRGKVRKAHRLALADHERIPLPASRVKALHSCDNPPCCNWRHLRWGDMQANSDDMIARGRIASRKGMKNARAKLTDADVLAIRAAYSSDSATQAALGAKYGVNQTMIGFIVRGVHWTHLRPASETPVRSASSSDARQ